MNKLWKILPGTLPLLLLSAPTAFANGAAHELVNAQLPVWSIIPFVGMLLSIAVIPLIQGDWWAENMKWVSLGWSLIFLIPFSIAYSVNEGLFRLLESVLLDYIPFIVLLFGLFVAAGGIAIKGTLA